MNKILVATIALILSSSMAMAQKTVSQIKQRQELLCGVGTPLAGFFNTDKDGRWIGFDVDLCRALAVAVLDDPEKVRFVALTSKNRFTALQSGEVDVLISNATWTMSRDTKLGLKFGPVNYYDGQGFMTRKSLNIKNARDLHGASVCVQQGTTSELNLADYARANKLTFETVTFADNDQTLKAYEAGRCDALTVDASNLAASRLQIADPEAHVLQPEIISKEPLAPVVRKGDEEWLDVVKWTHFAMLNAEELGVTKDNAQKMKTSDDPAIKRLLGTEQDFGEGLGLSAGWSFRIISTIGNYGEIYDRHLGPDSRLKIPRGLNSLWNRGGIQYAPPIR